MAADQRRRKPREVPRPQEDKPTAQEQRAQYDARDNTQRKVVRGHKAMLEYAMQRQGVARPVAPVTGAAGV